MARESLFMLIFERLDAWRGLPSLARLWPASRVRARTRAWWSEVAHLAEGKNLRRVLSLGGEALFRGLRPFEMADQAGLRRRATLDVVLAAAAAGLLRPRWVYLCPECGGPATEAGDAETSRAQVCAACSRPFAAEGASVDLVFELPSDIVLGWTRLHFGGDAASLGCAYRLTVPPGGYGVLRAPMRPERYRVTIGPWRSMVTVGWGFPGETVLGHGLLGHGLLGRDGGVIPGGAVVVCNRDTLACEARLDRVDRRPDAVGFIDAERAPRWRDLRDTARTGRADARRMG